MTKEGKKKKSRRELLTMQGSNLLHLRPPHNRSNLHQSLDIIIRLKDRKLVSQEKQEDDPSGPDVHSCGYWSCARGRGRKGGSATDQ